MHFGKALLTQRFEPWAPYYLDYNRLKRILEADSDPAAVEQQQRLSSTNASESAAIVIPTSHNFALALDEQVERTVFFFLQQQGAIAAKLNEWRIDQQKVLSSANQENDEQQCWQQLYQDLCTIAVDLLRLIQFVELNVTAIRKILKKHDRIFEGERSLSTQYLRQHEGETYGVALTSPLFEHGGLDALIKTVGDSFAHLHRSSPRPLLSEQQVHEQSDLMIQNGDNSMYDLEAASSSNHQQAIVARSYQSCNKADKGAMMNGGEEDIMMQIEVERRKLKETRDFVHMLAAQMLMMESSTDEFAPEGGDYQSRKRRISNFLNLLSTFFHLTDYYIVAPGCGTYAEKLGGTASLSGVIIGMNSVAALISTVLYSWWTSKSYKAPLICASACSVVGDVIYALALPLGSMKLVMLGRLFSGFGSARALNRRYIADTYPVRERTAASAAFVTAGALGTSAGPAFAACLYFAVPATSLNKYWQVENAPCWFMALTWAIYLVCLYYYFEEPPRPAQKAAETTKPQRLELSTVHDEQQPLLKNDRSDSIAAYSTASDTPSTQPLYENIPVMTTFCIYFVLKFILESLLSSTATLTNFYFGWEGSLAGTYLAILGLLVLPANWLVALVAGTHDDRQLILIIEMFMLSGCVAILNYTGSAYAWPQYVLGSIVIFVSTNALEGPTMSLLSKTIPPIYARGLLNVGLLATEAGTLGRAVGDVILTMCGANGLEFILNNAFGAMAALSVMTIAITRYFYRHLEPLENDR